MKNIIATILSLLLFSTCLLAQKQPKRTYGEDLGFTVGVNVPMYNGVKEDATVGVTYGRFNYSGLGFRAGLQYTPSVADVSDVIGIPIAFAYRTRSRSDEERLLSGIDGASAAFWDWFDGYGGNGAFADILGSFLINLVSNMEFTIGMTPGYIHGTSSSDRTAWYSDGYWENEWTERSSQFSLSLDAGANFNYRIWRFDIKLMPAFHYNLTNNYISHRTSGYADESYVTERKQPVRWFFSLSGGLAFKF